jgi:hypothetical protein
MAKTKSQRNLGTERRFMVRLNAVLDKNLLAYVAAAAAGIATQSAEAKVVYTPANIKIASSEGEVMRIDLNHDGIRDFVFNLAIYKGAILGVAPTKLYPQNAIQGTSRFASALSSGVTVGPGNNFEAHRERMASISCATGACTSAGPWKNAQGRYLGLKFIIRGKVHYGWVRMNVNAQTLETSTVITGYAYATEPNTAIVTGQTESPGQAHAPAYKPSTLQTPSRRAGTLGLLAQGSAGIPVWRREKAEEGQVETSER